MKVHNSVSTVGVATALALLVGCRMSAPIHVWQPPRLASAVGKQVAVSPIVGPSAIAEPLHAALLDEAPSDAGREVAMIDARRLQDETRIQLVTAPSREPSDVALAAVARREGLDYLLRGEVLSRRQRRRQTRAAPSRSPGGSSTAPALAGEGPLGDQPLIVSWRLTPLRPSEPGGGAPVVVEPDAFTRRYPDLANNGDPGQALLTAAVRDTYRLLTPSVGRVQVGLDIPYLLPGSKKVRRGNAAALAGRWGEAARLWGEVSEEHPSQVAAIHNSAIAAVAAQDFSRAKRLARRALRLQPSDHHGQTLAWIELRQRDYHAAFDLPAPPEGWYLTRAGAEVATGDEPRTR